MQRKFIIVSLFLTINLHWLRQSHFYVKTVKSRDCTDGRIFTLSVFLELKSVLMFWSKLIVDQNDQIRLLETVFKI